MPQKKTADISLQEKTFDTSLAELKAQISLGVIPNDNKLATLIKWTSDQAVLLWAAQHSSAKVRASAIKNLNLPLGKYIERGLFASTTTEKNAYYDVLEYRKAEVVKLLSVTVDWPQLSLNFDQDAVTPEYE